MQAAAVDVYVAAFVARCAVMRRPGQRDVDEPGTHGLLPSPNDGVTRLLVTDDRSYDLVVALLPDARAGMINVFAAAERCRAILEEHPAWTADAATAMVCRDLYSVPAVRLPSKLAFQPVRRLPDDAPDGVPLEDAVAAAMLAATEVKDPPGVLGDHLRSLPRAIRLFAAVDDEGAVRATAGSGAFGSEASVMFVNTDPDWRGRGIGQAMTAAALHLARESGARRASLDASDSGAGIYRRLGFEAVTRTTRFFRVG